LSGSKYLKIKNSVISLFTIKGKRECHEIKNNCLNFRRVIQEYPAEIKYELPFIFIKSKSYED